MREREYYDMLRHQRLYIRLLLPLASMLFVLPAAAQSRYFSITARDHAHTLKINTLNENTVRMNFLVKDGEAKCFEGLSLPRYRVDADPVRDLADMPAAWTGGQCNVIWDVNLSDDLFRELANGSWLFIQYQDRNGLTHESAFHLRTGETTVLHALTAPSF